MAATPQKPAAAPRRKVSRHRGEGQWAVGHFTPLNGNEQFKKDDDGLHPPPCTIRRSDPARPCLPLRLGAGFAVRARARPRTGLVEPTG